MKRVLSILLCIVLLFSMVPAVNVQAESGTATVDTQQGEVSIDGTDSFSNLLSNEINQSQEKATAEEGKYSGGYSVNGITIDGNIATVEYSSMEEANLIVALYTEDGTKLLTSGNVVVSPNEEIANVPIYGTMPQYFMASAFLVDNYDYSPLCPAYDTPMYTQEMQELLASTIDDYDQEKVLNLDESTDNNFAVYKDSVVVIDGGDGINTVVSTDYENDKYIIENANEQITSLTVGTVIAYPWAEGEVLIVKISTISVDGTTVTLTGAEMEIEEVFAYLKLDADGGMDDAEVDESCCEDGVVYEGVIEETSPPTRAWEGGTEVKKSLAFKVEKKFGTNNSVTVSGGAELSIKASLSFYISLNRQFVEVKKEANVGVNFKITGKLTAAEIQIAKIKIPMGIPGVVIDISPRIVLESQASIEFKASNVSTFGFSYDSNQGFKKLSSKPKVEADAAVKGKVFFGLKVKVSIAILDKSIASVGLSAKTGVQVTGELSGTNYEGTPKEDALEIHTCSDCIDASFDAVLEISAEAVFLKYFKVEKKFVSVTFHLFKFYKSLDSVNAGTGFGSCPYKAYRTSFSIKNAAGAPLKNVSITTDSGEKWGETNGNGVFVKYLIPGNYCITAATDTESVDKAFTISTAGSINIRIGQNNTSSSIPATGVFGTVQSDNITDIVVQKPIEITSAEAGVLYKLGSYNNGFGKTYFFNGELDDTYAGACTDWEDAVDVFLVETGNGYHLSYTDGEGSTRFINIVATDTYQYYSLSDVPETVYTWDSVNNTLVAEVDGIKWCFGMHSSYENFCTIAYESAMNYNIAHLYAIGYGKPDIVAANSCGKNATWSLDSDGVLTISGTGDMYNYPYQEVPWYSSINLIKKVVIEEGITKIGDSAFQHARNMQTVEIASTVKIIGRFAFDSCNNLQAVKIPEGVTQIANHAFWSCYKLTTVTIPDAVTSIGWRAFRYCNSLTSVVVGKSVESIDEHAFDGCTNLKNITFKGNSPSFTGVVFGEVTATAYYPVGDSTWTDATMLDYGGSISWESYVPSELSVAIEPEQKKPAVRGVYGGEYGIQQMECYVLKTASFKDLVPSQEYLLLALSSVTVEDPLSAENILFLDQAAAQEDGTLVFRYVQRENMDVSYVVACGASNQNLNDATISFPVMCADEEVQAINPTVIYDGKTLIEGQDYTIVGTVDFTEEGTYTCYVRGIFNYSGLVSCTYTVLNQTMVSAWNLTLGDQISVNFYMDIQEEIKETAIVNITLAGETVSYPVADKTVDEDNGYYIFSVDLAASQMTENVTVELVNNGEVLGSRSYSVRQYADYILSDNNGIGENVKALIREMLSYGGAAQVCFEYNTDNLANTGITGTAVNPVPYSSSRMQIVTSPVADKAFKMAMCRNDEAVMYFNGSTESASISYRLGTTTNQDEAVDVYLEEVSEGQYRLYFMDGETKTYIRVFHWTDGEPGFGKGSVELTTTVPAEYYTYDTAANTLVYDYDGNNAYYLGTYNSYTTFSVSNTAYITGNNAANVDVSQYPARLYVEEVTYDEALTVTPTGRIPDLSFYSASLLFRDRIAVRFYFTGDVTGCVFTANGTAYTPAAKDGMHYVEVADILPQDLDQQITLTVTDAEGNEISATYGPMNYIVRMSQKGSATLKNLLKALYNYHLAAKSYSASA